MGRMGSGRRHASEGRSGGLNADPILLPIRGLLRGFGMSWSPLHVAADFALPAYSVPNALLDERTFRLAFRSTTLAASAPLKHRKDPTATCADSETDR